MEQFNDSYSIAYLFPTISKFIYYQLLHLFMPAVFAMQMKKKVQGQTGPLYVFRG